MRAASALIGLNDPRLRGLFYQTLLVVVVVALASGAGYNAYQYAGPRYSDGLRLLELGSRLRYQSPADRLFSPFDLRAGLLGRSPQHPYDRRHQYSVDDTVRICDRLGASVTQLAAGARRACLYERFAQHAAAAATAVLVQCGSSIAAGAASVDQSLRCRVSQQPRPVSAAAHCADPEVWFASAVVLAIVAAAAFHVWARRRQDRTGAQAPSALITAALIIGLPAMALALAGAPFTFDFARLSGFNLKGGIQVFPEMAALVFGLVTFTAAFIAEIVRAGFSRFHTAKARRRPRWACIAVLRRG